jgi:hypothetical protein
MMPDSFGGFKREDVLKQLAKEKAEEERKKLEAERAAAERAAAEKKRLEDLARVNASKEQVVAPVSGVVFDNIEFGPCSDEWLNQPNAVSSAGAHGYILQSIGEAVLARKKINDEESWDYQRTRTGAFYVVENGKVYVAFDDIADAVKNVVVRYAREGFDDNNEGKEFLIRGSLLESVLERAKDANRFLELPEDNVVKASVVGSPCDYELNPYFVAVLGKEMACVNAELIRNKKHSAGKLYLLSAETVRKRAVDGKGLIRPVGLGDGNVIDYVDANDNFYGSGCARGVRLAQKAGGSQ